MNYAVVQTSGKQYKVEKGTVLTVDKMKDLKDGGEAEFDKVLLIVEDGKAQIGNPFIEGASVKAKVVSGEFKGEKLRIAKFLAKSRYRKVMGHRSLLSKVEVLSIDTGKKSSSKTK